MWRLLLAIKCFFLVLFARRLPAEAVELLPPPDLEPPRLPPPEADTVAKPSAKADGKPAVKEKKGEPTVDARESQQRGAILLLGVLQREGRLLDFLQENVDGFTDAQIGAAVRDIHRGCRKALGEHLKIEPVMGEPDNATVKVDTGFDPSRIRLVGNVAGNPPFIGTLRHPGWRSAEVTLPELPANHDPTVIAPAEVEL